MSNHAIFFLAISIAVLPNVACSNQSSSMQKNQEKASAKESKEKTIGSVKMLSDGVIVLTLRAKTGGVIGDAEFSFTKDEPKYAEILRHVGGLKPGEEKGFPEVPVVQE